MNSYYYLKSNKSLLYLAEIVPSASAENVYSYCALPKRMIRLVCIRIDYFYFNAIPVLQMSIFATLTSNVICSV